MDRRSWLVGSLTLLAAPLDAGAQLAARTYRVGFLSRGDEGGARSLLEAFLGELSTLGYTEGGNLTTEWRWVGARAERLSAMAAELVRANVDVIVAPGTLETKAAREATSTIPIVMVNVGDPVAAGFVRNLARPGTNVTGLSFLFPELSAKQLALFREIFPGSARIAVLWNPSNPSHRLALEALYRVASALGVQLQPVSNQGADGLGHAFATARRDGLNAVLVLGEPAIFQQRARMAELALRHGIATMFNLREHVEVGGLMAYGVHFPDQYRRAAGYVDRIFKGARPADLPVEQPARFELVVNIKTAKAIGLTIPQSLLLRADQVIE